tara:strand:+ start:100 stop:414 length:315 start_codon:yes stop_codon:yes gene_type:complete
MTIKIDIDEVTLCSATAVWNTNDIAAFGNEQDWVCEPDDVVESRATVEDFQKGIAKGKVAECVDTPAGVLHVWTEIQTRKGCRRGDLFVLQNGEKSFSYFNGGS